MSISVECPGCRSGFQVPDRLAGKRIRCKHCREEFLVDDAEPADDYDKPRRRSKRTGWSALEAGLFTMSILVGGLLIAVGVFKYVQGKIDAIVDDTQPQPVAVGPRRPGPGVRRAGISAGGMGNPNRPPGPARPDPAQPAVPPSPRVIAALKPAGPNGRPADPPAGPMVGKLANFTASGKDAQGRPMFKVTYTVQKPQGFGEWYFLVAKGPGGAGQVLLPDLSLQSAGTITFTFDPAFDPGEGVELWLEREPFAKPQERVKVSPPVTHG
jgi:hypothetical protein